ncbi:MULTISPECIES: hypothetical protein [Methanosarcina]|uniref:hypothetical protein n=1 Tax=Methanosarcina TaxID=2207 RepID=UPI001E34D764|nr:MULTISPECIES: hypothetical protein [Methanosarcina]
MIIAALAGLAFILMVILGLRSGQALDAIFIAGVALAVSAIPTGLLAVVTIMYSMGTDGSERHCQAATVGGNTRLGLSYLLRQNRHVDAQQDDSARVQHTRPESLQDLR